ncbi:MAG: diaminopimelate epimerase [Saprospiraceae bacterium]
MAQVPFSKYHGAGNDFIMIDDMVGAWGHLVTEQWVARACHRRFGIGADGMILLQPSTEGGDFFMKYYNSDGRTSTFCGNGGRCVVSFALELDLHEGQCNFLGTDGMHAGAMLKDGEVKLTMTNVDEVKKLDGNTFQLYTGSPHYVTFQDDISKLDVKKEGSAIRNSEAFAKDGINVNFVQVMGPNEIRIRTYERGVEDETFACGTGVVAAAFANSVFQNAEENNCIVHAQGGDLNVEFTKKADRFADVYLIGPAVKVFEGEIEI